MPEPPAGMARQLRLRIEQELTFSHYAGRKRSNLCRGITVAYVVILTAYGWRDNILN